MHKLDLTYTTRQGSRVSCLDRTGFAASFGIGVRLLISGSHPPMLKPNNFHGQSRQAVYLPPHDDKPPKSELLLN